MIRQLDDSVKEKLRLLAVSHGRSMETEAREIINAAVSTVDAPVSGQSRPEDNLAERIRRRFAPLGGVDLPIPPREPMPEPVRFDN